MEVITPLQNQTIISIQGLEELRYSLKGFGWVRLVLAFGVLAEIYPTSDSKDNKGYDQHGMAVEVVENFRPGTKWPGGPELKWAQIQQLEPFLNVEVKSSSHLDKMREGIDNAICISFVNGKRLTLKHSSIVPMTIEIITDESKIGVREQLFLILAKTVL